MINKWIKIDTSVFKYGRREGIVNFDYTHAHSQIVPWRVREGDFCVAAEEGELWEFPIYSEERWIGAFLTPRRVYRLVQTRLHGIAGRDRNNSAEKSENTSSLSRSLLRQGWRADFNQCGGRQLSRALDRETAAIGVPAYSIFHGRTGAVDEHLSEKGRLVLTQNLEGIKRIKLQKRDQSLNRKKM